MRGNVSKKLKAFLEQVNIAIAEAKHMNLPYGVETTRQNLENLKQFMSEETDVSFIEDRVLELDNRKVPVRVYNPNLEKSLPVIIHYHGGGHMCGSIELYDPVCRKLSISSEAIVLAVDYRLAPEHPYPAGLEDSEFVLENYRHLINDMKVTGEVIIAGDSAGGAICASLARNSLTNQNLKIDKQVLIYPSLDYTMSSLSVEENGEGFLLEKAKVAWYFSQYFQHEDTWAVRKSASPLFGAISSALPKTLLFSAGCDPLRDESFQYVENLLNHDACVEHVHFESMIHAFMLLDDLVTDECRSVYQKIAEFVRS